MFMSMEKLLKWFGILTLAAGLTRIGMTPSALIWGTDSPQELTFGIVACVLMAVCGIGLYLVQMHKSGTVGLLATLSLIFFNILTACMVWTLWTGAGTITQFTEEPSNLAITVTRIIIMIGMFLGTPAFTVVTYRAKVFPRWVVVLLVLSMVMPVLPSMEKWGAFFWGLSYVGMGYAMLAGKCANQSLPSDKEKTLAA
jgi:hypothetical protein